MAAGAVGDGTLQRLGERLVDLASFELLVAEVEAAAAVVVAEAAVVPAAGLAVDPGAHRV